MFDKAKVKVSQGIGEIDMKYNLSQKRNSALKYIKDQTTKVDNFMQENETIQKIKKNTEEGINKFVEFSKKTFGIKDKEQEEEEEESKQKIEQKQEIRYSQYELINDPPDDYFNKDEKKEENQNPFNPNNSYQIISPINMSWNETVNIEYNNKSNTRTPNPKVTPDK